MDEPLEFHLESVEPRLKLLSTSLSLSCAESPRCWHEGDYLRTVVMAPKDLPAGKYTIRVTGVVAGKMHSAEFGVVIDEKLNQRKRERTKAIEDLERIDPVIPNQTVAVEPAITRLDGTVPGPVFSAGISLRKIHAVLVLDRSGSMLVSKNCGVMKAAAIRFARGCKTDCVNNVLQWKNRRTDGNRSEDD